jgi:hypothetical protein
MDSQLAANTARLDEYGMTLVSKRLKVSNETVDATGQHYGVLSAAGKSNCPGSTGKVAISSRGAGIITCSRLFLTHRFSLGCRVFSAVPA